jgi:hypothetical protein
MFAVGVRSLRRASAPIYDQPLSVLISQFDGIIGWLVALVAGCAIVCTHLVTAATRGSFLQRARCIGKACLADFMASDRPDA